MVAPSRVTPRAVGQAELLAPLDGSWALLVAQTMLPRKGLMQSSLVSMERFH